MSHVIIVNRAGFPVYHDSTNPHSWSVSTQMHAMGMQMRSNMGQTDTAFRSAKFGLLTSVIGAVDGYLVLVVGSHAYDSVNLLHSQAILACRIMHMLLGGAEYHRKISSNKNLFGHICTMQPLVAAATALTRHCHSALSHSTERVFLDGPLGETNRVALQQQLASASRSHAPNVFNSLLFARGKMAATWARDAEREGMVQPADILLLHIVYNSMRRETDGGHAELPSSRVLHLQLTQTSRKTTPCKVIFGQIGSALTVILIQRQTGSTQNETKSTSEAKAICGGIHNVLRLGGLCEYIDVRARDHVNIKYYTSKFPGLVQFTFVDRKNSECFAPRVASMADFKGTLVSAYMLRNTSPC